MRKLITTLLLLLTAQFALAQGQSFINKHTDISTFRGGSKSDSLNIIPQDTLKPTWYVGSLVGSIAVKNGLFYWFSGGKYHTFDTSKLSLRIEQRLRYADTTLMLTPYATKANLADTSATLRALIGGGGVSPATSAELNTGTDNTKFASALALEGSKYLDQDGSKIYAVTTGTATAYVIATTPSFTPATGTVLNVKFHLANTGAATINVNGSGAVALQKDLSTALVANDIPINSEYQLLRTNTGWLIKDIGLAGVTTGTLLPVRQSSPALLGTPTAPTAAVGTNTTQLATTAHVFAERTSTSTLTNKTLTSPSIATPLITGVPSGTINDSLLVADATTGAVKRISSARIASGSSSISGLTTNYIPVATSSTAIGNSVMAQNGANIGVGTTTASAYLEGVGNGNSIAGGYSNCVSAVSANFPAISIRETNSGLGNGYMMGLLTNRATFRPLVNPRNAAVLLGYDGTMEGIELESAADIQGISYKNIQSYKYWNQWNIGTSAIPSSAPQGSFVTYGADIGYAHIITKEGRHILSSPASIDDGVSTLQVNGISKATQFRLSDLNTAPSSSTDTGVKGEIRVTAGYIYICTATNTWVRTALSTF